MIRQLSTRKDRHPSVVASFGPLRTALPMSPSRRTLIIEQSPGGLTNFASSASVTASSSGSYNGVQTAPSGAVDGTNTPWVSASGGAGQWILLTFQSRIQMNLIYIYDRGNPNDQIASGQLRFDDGSVVACGPANNDGSATPIGFPSLLSSTILFTITSVSQTTTDVGLTEFQVFYNQSAASPSAASVFSTSATSDATDTAGLGVINTTPFGSALPTPNLGKTFTSVITKDGITSTVTSIGAGSTSDSGSNKHAATHPIGAIAGGAAGAVVLVLLACIYFCFRRPSSSRRRDRLEIEGLDTSAAETKYPARSQPPPAPTGSYLPFNHHPLPTGQTGFTRFSSPNTSDLPPQSGPPVTIQSSPRTSSPLMRQDASNNSGFTPPLVRTPSSHRKSPPTLSLEEESAASSSRPLSFSSQGTSGPSSGNAQMRPQSMAGTWERGNSVDQRPVSVFNDAKSPITMPEEQHTAQQTRPRPQSVSAHNLPSSSSEWNPWNDISIERPLSPRDAPPRYETLAP